MLVNEFEMLTEEHKIKYIESLIPSFQEEFKNQIQQAGGKFYNILQTIDIEDLQIKLDSIQYAIENLRLQGKEKISIEDLKKELNNNYNFIGTPSSPWAFVLRDLLNHHGKGKPIETTRTGRKKTDLHRELIYVKDEDNPEGFGLKSINHQTNEIIEIFIRNPQLLKSGKSTRKIFSFLLTKSNEQNFSPEIIFNLNELVENGMYKSIVSARTGANKAIDAITNIAIKGNIKKGKKQIKNEKRYLFPGYVIENNVVSVQLNPLINIEFIAPYFALLPSFIYSLNNNAFALCEYIFLLARQNGKNIKEKGSFNISLKKIRESLALPNPDETQKHKQYIKEPILEAIAEINNEAKKTNDFYIEIEPDNNKQIKEWLNSFITITIINENLKQNYIKIIENKEIKIKKLLNKKEKKKKAETF